MIDVLPSIDHHHQQHKSVSVGGIIGYTVGGMVGAIMLLIGVVVIGKKVRQVCGFANASHDSVQV